VQMVLLKQGLSKMGGRRCAYFCEYRHGSRQRTPYMTVEIWQFETQRIHLTIFHSSDDGNSGQRFQIHLPMNTQDKSAQQLIDDVQSFIKNGRILSSSANGLQCAAK